MWVGTLETEAGVTASKDATGEKREASLPSPHE